MEKKEGRTLWKGKGGGDSEVVLECLRVKEAVDDLGENASIQSAFDSTSVNRIAKEYA